MTYYRFQQRRRGNRKLEPISESVANEGSGEETRPHKAKWTAAFKDCTAQRRRNVITANGNALGIVNDQPPRYNGHFTIVRTRATEHQSGLLG